ncbi:MAG: IS5 family transposase [Terricaulis sp.]
MRGEDQGTGSMFSYVVIEARVPADHPLRLIRRIVNDALASLDHEFEVLYAGTGRPSIAPEKLLRGSLIQAFYSVRSERQLMEPLDYNLLFRWFVGLGVDDPVWDHSTYSRNRDRLLEGEIARKFLKAIVAHDEVAPLLSDDHFSVDGTMINAGATIKSLVPREQASEAPPPDDGGSQAAPGDGDDAATATGKADATKQNSGEEGTRMTTIEQQAEQQVTATPLATEASAGRNAMVDFHGQKRSNATHVSTTDPEARLYRKGSGKEARLAFIGHALAENRHGLIVAATLTTATGTAERDAAIDLVVDHSPGSSRQLTLGGDKGYDTRELVDDLRALCVTPHVAQNTSGRRSAIDARTTRHPGYAISQCRRKLIEEAFGWGKTIGGLARPMLQGVDRLRHAFTFTMAAYNLIRLPKLIGAVA